MARRSSPDPCQCPHGIDTVSHLHLAPPSMPPLQFAHIFPPREPPPPRPNTDPRCNRAPPRPSCLPHITTPLIRKAWAFHLRDYPDQSFVKSLLHIIEHGALLGFYADDHPQICKNLISCNNDPEAVTATVGKLLQNSHAHGPYLSPPFLDFRLSPLGLVSRKRSNKLRLIHHLSWPHGTSVNDGIPDSEANIHYESFESALQVIHAYGPGTLLAKLDLKEAFHHIPVAPSQWHLLGFHWQSQFYHSVVLTFGLRSAPYIFNLFAEGLHWIIRRHIPRDIRHYLDDFLPIFQPRTTLPVANAAISWCQSLGEQLGLNFQHEKTVMPCTCLEFLGLEIDTVSMEARLPDEKLGYLREILDSAIVLDSMSLMQVQELVGFLQFASQVIPHSRAFIRRLIDFSMTFASPFTRRRVPAYARADIHWWRSFAHAWNGIRLINPSSHTVHVYTDASGTKGIGGVFDDQWFSSRAPRRFRHWDIQFKEIYAVLHATLRWGHLWRHQHVIFHVDNEAIVSTLNKETTRARFTMSVTRQLVMLAAFLDFSFSSSWLPSAANTLADAASRYEFSRLFIAAPSLSRQNCKIYPQLTGIRSMLISRPLLHSSSGMASPHPPERLTAQVSGPSSTSSAFTPIYSTQMAPTSQPTNRQYWNGSRIWATPSGSSRQPSSLTWGTSSPSTLTPTYLSMQLSHQWFSASSVVSSGTSATGTAGLRHPSPSQFSSASSPSPLRTLPSSMPPLTQPSNWHLQGSCALENSRSRKRNIRPLTHPRTLHGAPYPSTRPLTPLLTSASPSQLPKLTRLGRASRFILPPSTPLPVPSKPYSFYSRPIPGQQTHPYFATAMALPSNILRL